MKGLDYFQHTALANRRHVPHKDFAATHGAAAGELAKVEEFAQTQLKLEVTAADAAKRSVVVRGTAAQLNKAFAIELHHYRSPLGEYHGHEGQPALPTDIADIVELIVGLDDRPVPARHYSTTLPPAAPATPGNAASFVSADPPNTVSLTPQQVARLYNFPEGTGSGQTIGIYEMPTSDGSPGYDLADVTATINAFGGDLKVIKPVDVSVDGQQNTGTTDPETAARWISPLGQRRCTRSGDRRLFCRRRQHPEYHPRPSTHDPPGCRRSRAYRSFHQLWLVAG